MRSSANIVFDWLTVGSTGLFTLAASRVWLGKPPENFNNTSRAVVYHPESGASNSSGSMHNETYVFKCYGGDDDILTAETLYRALWDRLQRAFGTVSAGRLVHAEQVASGQALEDPDQGWPFYLTKFQVMTEEA